MQNLNLLQKCVSKLCLVILPCLQAEGTMVLKSIVLSPFLCYFWLCEKLGKETEVGQILPTLQKSLYKEKISIGMPKSF